MIAYQIRDATGTLVAIHERNDGPDGKHFLWRRADGTLGLNGTSISDLPLYGIDRLGAERTVLVTEGEKSADALIAVGIPAVATVTGASATPRRSALAELSGRAVILWPDNDEPGHNHMSRIAKSLKRLGAGSVAWLEWPEAPPGGDAADFLTGRTRADVVDLVETARELPIIRARGEPHADTTVATFPEPEDRGTATLSPLGDTEYVEDLVRPGRIVVWAAEESAGKTTTAVGELGIRSAVAGGTFAGTWPGLRTGPVLVLSEQHPDDDYANEDRVLGALRLERSALSGRYYRLNLMTAARGKPALTVPEWREWVTEWLRNRAALVLIVDTATGATQIDPWGEKIQAVYRDLRLMLDGYPALSIVLLLHLKKPQGRGERRISDVLGEWGRWCDIIVLQEADGTTRTKLSTLKRVRHQRRIAVSRADGLLVDPVDLNEAKASKVPLAEVLAAILAKPGMTYAELGKKFDVTKNTISGYVAQLGDQVDTAKSGPRGAVIVFPAAQSLSTAQ